MRITLDPPAARWPAPDPHHGADRRPLRRLVAEHAHRLGTAELPDRPAIIATGHQAWLWHCGILAKDLAMAAACRRHDAAGLHLVVDQDAHDALSLTLPHIEGDRLSARTVRLAPTHPDVPTGLQAPADPAAITARLDALDEPGLARLREAIADLPATRTLAEQVTALLARLMRPPLGELPVLFVSDLPRLETYRQLLAAMLHDARAAAAAYNRAVAAVPEAGLTPLRLEPDRVELPLWLATWNQPRRRVFADLADTTPLFTDDAGQPIDPPADPPAPTGRDQSLLPRALLLTAFMRSHVSATFIHGTGGGLYDRATDHWWRAWRGQPLAPAVVATADVHLPLPELPIADADALARARWLVHHAPYNVDRLLGLDDALTREKRRVLGSVLAPHARARTSPRQRRLAFAHLHLINARLASAHSQVIARARAELDRARLGLSNAATARRRDWPFFLYSDETLAALRRRIDACFAGQPAACNSGD